MNRSFPRLWRRALLVLAIGVVAGGVARAQGYRDWKPLGPRDIFPSMLISLARVAGEKSDGLVDLIARPGDQVVGEGNLALWHSTVHCVAPTALVLEVSCPKFMEPSQARLNATALGAWKIFPVIKWKFDALYSVTEPEPVGVTFRLLDGAGRELERREWTVTVHSLNECVIEWGSEEMKESQPSVVLFAAYVNENHPLIDRILKTALERKLVNQFLGPQAPDEATERRELAALWGTLQAMGFRYSSVARVATGTPHVKTQNVRFLDEALNNAQANCVDGSVLLASVFLRLGLAPELLLVPGHCFLKVKYPHSGDVFLETTLLGSGATVEQSQASATKRYQTVEKRFDESEGYERVDLREARAVIQPLRSRRGAASLK